MFLTTLSETRWAARRLTRSPGFTLMVALVLALGIGANTVVFTVVDALLNPFDYPDGDRLVGVGPSFPKSGQELSFWETLSPREYLDIASEATTLQKVVCWDMGFRQVAGSERPESTFTGLWWGDALQTLGVQPVVGRGFVPEDQDRAVAVISHRFWQRRFGGDPQAVGSRILVDGRPHVLVGVMPPNTLIYGTDLWLPMGVAAERFARNRRQMQVLARLADGVTMEEANTELAALAGRIEQEYGAEFEEYDGWRLRAVTWAEINTDMLRPAGLTLMGAVGFVLLLVCTTLASLFLARSLQRRKEVAVRAALGAGRARLISVLLVESLLVALLGGALGILAAVQGVNLIGTQLASNPFIPIGLEINGRVLLFCAAVSVLAGLLLGLLPAVRVSRTDLQPTLAAEGPGLTLGIGRQRLQSWLVGLEVGVAVVLLVGGGLFAHNLLRLQSVDPGFDAAEVLTMRLTLSQQRSAAEVESFLNTLIERVEALPGVEYASAASQLPPRVFQRRQFWIEGSPRETDGPLPTAYTTLVQPDYFEALGIGLQRGRNLEAGDRPGSTPVAVINAAAARRYFDGRDPVGSRFRLDGPDSDNPLFEVVGVVESVRNRGPQVAPEPEFYASLNQLPGLNQFHLVVRTTANPRSLVDPIRDQVQTIDPNQAVYLIETLDEAFAGAIASQRVATIALAAFGLFALTLAAAGIAAVVSFKVAARRHEIGVRMALGAARHQVQSLIVRQAMLPVLLGTLAGLAAAGGFVRLLGSQIDGLEQFHLLPVLAVLVLLGVIAAAASLIPARRAVRTDPLRSLRLDG